ncbi:MAG: phosphatase PAP2 family protein [Acidobacteriota bacterium]
MSEPKRSTDKVHSARLKAYAIELLIGLAVAGSLLTLLRWMASEVFEGDTNAFDQAVRNGIHSASSPALTSFFIGVSFIGSPVFLITLGVVAVIAFAYLGKKRGSILIVITMAGEIVLDVGLKGIYARARPEPFFNYALPQSFSFPSGHALGSLCFYGIVAWIIATRTTSLAIRWTAPSTAALLILLVGVSRIYLGVHYPTDVLAGFTAGAVWTAAVCLGDHYFSRPSRLVE